MELCEISVALDRLQGRANPYYRLGAAKVMLQTQGVDVVGPPLPDNSDGVGTYLILSDDLMKIDVPVYAHRSAEGYKVAKARTLLDVHFRPIRLDFERPYLAFRARVDGAPFRDICNIEYDGHLALTANHGCLYFKEGTACGFCAIPQWRDAEDRSTKRLIQAATHALALGEVKHLSITTGTMPGPDRGIRSILTVLARLARAADLSSLPIFAEFEPPEDPIWLDKLRDMGVATVSCNLEFLMPSRRMRYMPGKGVIPFQRFVKVWERAVKLFGRGQVFSNVLMIADDISLVEQLDCPELDTMIEIGVIPSPGPLYPDPASIMSALLPPPHEAIHFLDGVAQRLFSAGLNPRRALAGCHRNGAYSAINQFYEAHSSCIGMAERLAPAAIDWMHRV